MDMRYYLSTRLVAICLCLRRIRGDCTLPAAPTSLADGGSYSNGGDCKEAATMAAGDTCTYSAQNSNHHNVVPSGQGTTCVSSTLTLQVAKAKCIMNTGSNTPANGALGTCAQYDNAPTRMDHADTCQITCNAGGAATPGYKDTGVSTCNDGTATHASCTVNTCNFGTIANANSVGTCTATMAQNTGCTFTCNSGYNTNTPWCGYPGTGGAITYPLCILIVNVGSDPVTYFGDVRREFILPLGGTHDLMVSSELVVTGSTFPGNPHEQWFDKIGVLGADRVPLFHVSVKKDIISFNRSSVARDAFETVDVRIGREGGEILRNMPAPKEGLVLKGRPVSIDFWKMKAGPLVRTAKIGKARRECVGVYTREFDFAICSAPAVEYFGKLWHLAILYAHLDVILVRMPQAGSVTGILPELWGLAPMSQETSSYIVPDRDPASTTVAPLSGLARQKDVASEASNASCAGAGWIGSPTSPSKMLWPLGDARIS